METRHLNDTPNPNMAHTPSHGFEVWPAEITATNSSGMRYVFHMNPPKVRVISFKGGGSRVFVYTKFLEVADQYGLLNSVEEVGGSSSGSIAALFGALYYENPQTRTEALNEVTNCDRYDIYTNSIGSKIYQALTLPLYIISKPLEWLGKGLGWIAAQCNKILPGKILGIPLAIIATLIKAASSLTSPRFYAGLSNLIRKGGVYHGDEVQNTLRERIRKDTHAGLHAILSKMDKLERRLTIDRIIQIGLGKAEDGKLVLTPEITLAHLAELSIMTGGKFKEYYCTAVKVSDNSLMIFNKDNAPNMPLHLATRLAITFPRYYQTRSWQGEAYIDGGAINNAPVSHATPKDVSEFKSQQGVTDNMSRLNVRVEYPQEYQNHLWNKAPEKSWISRKIQSIIRAIAIKFTGGIDVFATDAEVTKTMQNQFAQQTLQLPDFGVGQMEDNVSPRRRSKIDGKIEKIVLDYFDNHTHPDVKAVIKHYQKPTDMPPAMQVKMLKYLRNPTIHTENIFMFPGKSAQELEIMRDQHIALLSQLVENDASLGSTATIARTLDYDIEQVGVADTIESNTASQETAAHATTHANTSYITPVESSASVRMNL